MKGIKNIFFVFNNLPIFSAFELSPSFALIPRRTGLLSLRCDLTPISTDVSYIDDASFAILLP